MTSKPVSTAGKPRVSVIITSCNGSPWIAQAVRSVLSQTYQDFEILVVDDASRDDSRDILKRFLSDPRVRLFMNPQKSGIPGTKNAGIRATSGEYVAFLEQDDEWLPQKLARQVSVLDAQPEVGMVAAAAVIVDTEGREWIQRKGITIPTEPREDRVRSLFLRNLVTSMSSVVLRRECLIALDGFDEAYSGADDYDFWLRLADGYRIVRLKTPLIRFRLHSQSYSSKNAEQMLTDLPIILSRAVERNSFLLPMKRKRLERVQLVLALRAFENGASRNSLRQAFDLLRRCPRMGVAYPIALLMTTGKAGRFVLKLAKAALFRIRFRKLRRADADVPRIPERRSMRRLISFRASRTPFS